MLVLQFTTCTHAVFAVWEAGKTDKLKGGEKYEIRKAQSCCAKRQQRFFCSRLSF